MDLMIDKDRVISLRNNVGRVTFGVSKRSGRYSPCRSPVVVSRLQLEERLQPAAPLVLPLLKAE